MSDNKSNHESNPGSYHEDDSDNESVEELILSRGANIANEIKLCGFKNCKGEQDGCKRVHFDKIPCAFHLYKSDGCDKGDQCLFPHLIPVMEEGKKVKNWFYIGEVGSAKIYCVPAPYTGGNFRGRGRGGSNFRGRKRDGAPKKLIDPSSGEVDKLIGQHHSLGKKDKPRAIKDGNVGALQEVDNASMTSSSSSNAVRKVAVIKHDFKALTLECTTKLLDESAESSTNNAAEANALVESINAKLRALELEHLNHINDITEKHNKLINDANAAHRISIDELGAYVKRINKCLSLSNTQ